MMFENQLIIIVAIIFKLKYTRHSHARTQGVHQSIHIVFALHFSNWTAGAQKTGLSQKVPYSHPTSQEFIIKNNLCIIY